MTRRSARHAIGSATVSATRSSAVNSSNRHAEFSCLVTLRAGCGIHGRSCSMTGRARCIRSWIADGQAAALIGRIAASLSGFWFTFHRSKASCIRSQDSGVVSATAQCGPRSRGSGRAFGAATPIWSGAIPRAAGRTRSASCAGRVIRPPGAPRRGVSTFAWGLLRFASVVILQVNVNGVFTLEAEGHPPVARQRTRHR